MPRLSLYRPEKGNDYKFIDKNIWEMFQVGGTDVLVHKYIGPGSAAGVTPSTPGYTTPGETQIQDLLFLENRDRKYDPDVYVMRGVYNISDIDFNLSQFGLFLQNDTIFISFHINDTVEKLGRKIMAGDVIELPHLKDDHALNDLQFALKRFFVIEEVSRAAEGFSVTWYPHLYRAKCKPLVDSQEFKDILDGAAGEGSDQSLRDIMSTYEKEMQITQAVLNQAESDAPRSGYDTSKFYTVRKDTDGNAELVTVDNDVIDSYSADRTTQATDADGIVLYEQPAWSSTKKYKAGDIFAYSNINAGNFRIDHTYTILSLGNTNWNTIANTTGQVYSVGDSVLAKTAGSGTGTAHEIYNADATKFTVILDIPTTFATAPTPPDSTYYVNSGIADIEYVGVTASSMLKSADEKYYNGYITQDGLPPNGAPFTAGIAFPVNPTEGQFCLRKDYMPNRLFRFNGSRWVKVEDIARMTMSNLGASDTGTGDVFDGKDVRQTQKTSFINNEATAKIDGRTVQEKQSLSKALRPKADE
jgi:hypothetical protein